MDAVTRLIPRQPVPELEVPLLGGGRYRLAEQPDAAFHLLVFYRGLHCPVCAKYLTELERLWEQFQQRQISVLALSTDTEARAAAMAAKIQAKHLPFGHSLPLATARAWGLSLSRSRGKTSIGIEEPELFTEPGLFLVRPDGSLYWASTQTMPFARPRFDDILAALDFVHANDYPARGEYTGPV